jgi:hypothetical protein
VKHKVLLGIVAVAAVAISGVIGYVTGLSAGMKAGAGWSSLAALGGLAAAEETATIEYLHGDYKAGRAALLGVISQADQMQAQPAMDGVLGDSLHHAKAVAYTRLALLERRNGTREQAGAFMNAAIAEASRGGWKSPTEERLVSIVSRMDRNAMPTPTPATGGPGA